MPPGADRWEPLIERGPTGWIWSSPLSRPPSPSHSPSSPLRRPAASSSPTGSSGAASWHREGGRERWSQWRRDPYRSKHSSVGRWQNFILKGAERRHYYWHKVDLKKQVEDWWQAAMQVSHRPEEGFLPLCLFGRKLHCVNQPTKVYWTAGCVTGENTRQPEFSGKTSVRCSLYAQDGDDDEEKAATVWIYFSLQKTALVSRDQQRQSDTVSGSWEEL